MITLTKETLRDVISSWAQSCDCSIVYSLDLADLTDRIHTLITNDKTINVNHKLIISNDLKQALVDFLRSR